MQLIPVAPVHEKHCDEFAQKLLDQGIRVEVDHSDERLGKRIRNGQIKKIPYQIVFGDDEIKSKSISYRKYGKSNVTNVPIAKFGDILLKRIQSHK
ncbi:MAG: His/Gly/Thr/Pro-type tRNA ligase C-terminal domain-containing protein [Mycoplasmoidaceae bacterium]|nr:His/Gly/Thr/Pro-type tRNA ligase C-terminal domain-containing protein [Mycoplasmoidaceae bacterium]